jgi:hypothetical protein
LAVGSPQCHRSKAGKPDFLENKLVRSIATQTCKQGVKMDIYPQWLARLDHKTWLTISHTKFE